MKRSTRLLTTFALAVVTASMFVLNGCTPTTFSTGDSVTPSPQVNSDTAAPSVAPVVFDCSKFSLVSIEELIDELGEPDSVEDWTNKTSKGDFPLKIYTYSFDGFYGEFITHENTVVKLHLFSDSSWKVGGKTDSIFAMFGVVPGESIKKVADTGVVLRFSNVSDKVAEMDFYNFDEHGETFDIVYVTYNPDYFD